MEPNNRILNPNLNSFVENPQIKNSNVNETPLLPPEILERIFSCIPNYRDMDIQLLNGVNKCWNEASIEMIKHRESKSISSLFDFLKKNHGLLQQTMLIGNNTLTNWDKLTRAVEENKIQNSDNLKDIKESSSFIKEKMVVLVENLFNKDYKILEKAFLINENSSKFETNLFALVDLKTQIETVISCADVFQDVGSYFSRFALKLAKIKQYDKAIDLANSIYSFDGSHVQSDLAFMNIIYKLLDESLFVKAAKTHGLMDDEGNLKDPTFSTILEKLKENGRIEKIQDVADATTDLNFKQQALDLVKQMKRADL